VGFFRYREIYPDGSQKWWLGNRRLAGAGQFRSCVRQVQQFGLSSR
jgi:hypothetical protein